MLRTKGPEQWLQARGNEYVPHYNQPEGQERRVAAATPKLTDVEEGRRGYPSGQYLFSQRST